MFALGDGVFGSAAAFAAFLDALVLPLLLPENEVLLRLYFLGVVWLVVVIVTKFAGGATLDWHRVKELKRLAKAQQQQQLPLEEEEQISGGGRHSTRTCSKEQERF